jgi:alkylated DNA nucleotide flippase Atl1
MLHVMLGMAQKRSTVGVKVLNIAMGDRIKWHRVVRQK